MLKTVFVVCESLCDFQERRDGWMDGWMDGWKDRWMDGWIRQLNNELKQKIF